MGSVFSWVAGALFGKRMIDSMKPSVPKQDIPATPAVPAPTVTSNQETGVDTTGQQIKRKAKGKRGLMIQPTNTGGSATGIGGTGLNL